MDDTPSAPPTSGTNPQVTIRKSRSETYPLTVGFLLSSYSSLSCVVFFLNAMFADPSADWFMRYPALATVVAAGLKLTPVALVYALWLVWFGLRRDGHATQAGAVRVRVSTRSIWWYLLVLGVLVIPILIIGIIWIGLVLVITAGFTRVPF